MNAIDTAAQLLAETLTSGSKVGVEVLYTLGESIFAAAAPDVWAAGWNGIIPQTQDRKPAPVYNATIRPGHGRHRHRERAPDAETRQKWLDHCASYNVALYFGATSGHTFAVDIDCMDDVGEGCRSG